VCSPGSWKPSSQLKKNSGPRIPNILFSTAGVQRKTPQSSPRCHSELWESRFAPGTKAQRVEEGDFCNHWPTQQRTSAKSLKKKPRAPATTIANKGGRRRSPLLPTAKKRKLRAGIDTSVLVAGISGFRDRYIAGKNPSADILHRWAEKNNFIWLLTEDILDECKESSSGFTFVQPNRQGHQSNSRMRRTRHTSFRPPSHFFRNRFSSYCKLRRLELERSPQRRSREQFVEAVDQMFRDARQDVPQIIFRIDPV
jgi:hypothetical protein